MFISKQRPIAIPQAEHQKLAGALALLWGNAEFDRPPIALDSFLAGVALHDRVYGALDNLPIGGIPEADWLDLTQRGFEMTWADPVADLITKLHLQRLTGYGKAPARQAQAAAMAQVIADMEQRLGLDPTLFARIDRITNLCDSIAFDVCFEAPAAGTVKVFPSFGAEIEVEVHYQTTFDPQWGSTITVNPWPFTVLSHEGYMVGYKTDGYPTELEPVMVLYRVTPEDRL